MLLVLFKLLKLVCDAWVVTNAEYSTFTAFSFCILTFEIHSLLCGVVLPFAVDSGPMLLNWR